MPLMIPGPGRTMVPYTPPPWPVGADPRLAMLAELCPHGAGPCGCGAAPRLCGRPDRPAEVWRATCLGCVARGEWERGVEAIG